MSKVGLQLVLPQKQCQASLTTPWAQQSHLARLVDDAHVKQLVLEQRVVHAKAGGAKLRGGRVRRQDAASLVEACLQWSGLYARVLEPKQGKPPARPTTAAAPCALASPPPAPPRRSFDPASVSTAPPPSLHAPPASPPAPPPPAAPTPACSSAGSARLRAARGAPRGARPRRGPAAGRAPARAPASSGCCPPRCRGTRMDGVQGRQGGEQQTSWEGGKGRRHASRHQACWLSQAHGTN